MPKKDAIAWMWPEACAMLARAERMQHQIFHVAEAKPYRTTWEPPADVLETRELVVILIGLPGVHPESVQAIIQEETLVVIGDRFLPKELGRVFVHRMELPLGRFERKVKLPRGRYHDVRFTTSDGCLVVTLSKVV
jgi:HSP20 family molecular chaperone IbpA